MDNKALTDEELGTVVDQKTQEAVGWFNSKLSLEREQVMRYYNGELPKRTSNGSSSFVSTDVYDGIESMKAQILETYSAGQRIVKFDPMGADDIADTRIATKYMDYVVYHQNDAQSLFGTTLDDGLKARVGVAKVWWDECEDYTDHEFDDIDEDEAKSLASHEDIHEFSAEESSEGSGRYSGKMTKKVDKSQLRIEIINPEEFSVEPQCKGLTKQTFCVQRSIKTIDDLLRMGYKRSQLENWNAHEDMILKSNPEVLARFTQIDSGVSAQGSEIQDQLRKVLITEAYIWCVREGDKHACLYKVVRLGTETLEVCEVEDLPFVTFVPLPVAHSFYGNNFGSRIIPTQNARTVLMRSILDHTAITTNPRTLVLKGGVVNPKELLDNRLGGVVNITRPDAVTPMLQANLNPFVFQTMEAVKAHNEETTGISSLSQGLNKDAVSKQNSGAMVEKLISLSQTRQKIIARQFGFFLKQLYEKAYNIILVKEKRKRIVEVAGEWHEVDVQKWKEGRSASVSLHLGYGDMDRAGDALARMGATIAQDPVLNAMLPPQGRYKMAMDVAEMKGVYNLADYLIKPEQVKPPQPDPMKLKEQELEERKVAAQEALAQAAQSKVDMHGKIEASREQLAELQRKFDNMIKERDADRKDADIAHKIDVGQREIAITEKTPATTEVVNVSPK